MTPQNKGIQAFLLEIQNDEETKIRQEVAKSIEWYHEYMFNLKKRNKIFEKSFDKEIYCIAP